MTRARSASKVLYPAPVQGLDFRIPITEMPPQYSPFMLNFFVEGGKLKKRATHTTAVTSTTADGLTVVAIPPGVANNTKPIIINKSKTDNGSTSSDTPDFIASGTQRLYFSADWCVHKDLIYVSGLDRIYSIDTSTLAYTNRFTLAGTGGPPSSSQRRPIVSYRGSLYCGRGTDLEYSNFGAISGTMNVFSIAEYLYGTNINGHGIIALGVLSTSFGVGPEQYLVLVTTTGQVQVWTGAYPGASDWALVSQFNIDIQRGNNFEVEIINVPNDLLINAKYGYQIYSLRELLSSGSSAATFTKLDPIKPLFEAIVPTSDATFGERTVVKTCAYWGARNSLVCFAELLGTEHYFLGNWTSYITGGIASGKGKLIFLIDLTTGACTMHDAQGGSGTPYAQIRASNNYVMMPGTDVAYKLFDNVASSRTSHHAICCFPPLRINNNDTTSVKNLLLYSNLTTSHTLQHGITKDYDSSPSNFTAYTTSKTANKVNLTVLPGSQQGQTFITQIRESSNHSIPFELYGIDVLFESGGLY